MPEWRRSASGDRLDFLGVEYQMNPVEVAALEWDRPGGILSLKGASAHNKVLVWTPEDGRPMRVSATEPLDPLLLGLLGVPPGSGSGRFATTPTASASTSPAAAPN